jgi:hypothetical protein
VFVPLVAAVVLIPVLLFGAALSAWLQITRDVIAEEGEEEDAEPAGTPLIGPHLTETLRRNRRHAWGPPGSG